MHASSQTVRRARAASRQIRVPNKDVRPWFQTKRVAFQEAEPVQGLLGGSVVAETGVGFIQLVVGAGVRRILPDHALQHASGLREIAAGAAPREGEEPPVVVELKRSFSVPLLVQGIDRQRLTDRVYVAIELPNSVYQSAGLVTLSG